MAVDGIDATVSTTVPMEREALAAQHAGNRNDIWFSRDGIHWVQQSPPPPPKNWPTNRRGFDFLSLSTYLLSLFLVSKYLLLYASTLKLKWLRPEGLVMIDCFRGAWRRGAGLSEPGRSGAGPRAYWRGSRHRGARRMVASSSAARGDWPAAVTVDS